MLAAEGEKQTKQGAAVSTTTPRRTPPADRFDFRGEHAGVIYTPSGWRAINMDAGVAGPDFFSPYAGHRGLSVYVPFAYDTNRDRNSVALGASYEIVYRKPRSGRTLEAKSGQPAGRYEARAKEVVIPGEFVDVFHPAVYETDENGVEQLVQREETTRVPKVRIVIDRVWVEDKALNSGATPR